MIMFIDRLAKEERNIVKIILIDKPFLQEGLKHFGNIQSVEYPVSYTHLMPSFTFLQ